MTTTRHLPGVPRWSDLTSRRPGAPLDQRRLFLNRPQSPWPTAKQFELLIVQRLDGWVDG